MKRVGQAGKQELDSGGRRSGITLLELLIVLMIAGVIVLVALPTLRPSDDEAVVEFAKTQLRYLYNQENAYFTRYGSYVPFNVLAADTEIGSGFDQRFRTAEPVVDGVKFRGPRDGAVLLEITAILPDGTGYIIDTRGEISQYQAGGGYSLSPAPAAPPSPEPPQPSTPVPPAAGAGESVPGQVQQLPPAPLPTPPAEVTE